jgi:hypothetical protein
MKNGVSGMLCRVPLVRTDVSDELSASIIRVTRIGELGKTLAVTSNRRTLRQPHDVTSQKTPFKRFHRFMKLQGSLPYSQELHAFSYPEPDESRTYRPIFRTYCLVWYYILLCWYGAVVTHVYTWGWPIRAKQVVWVNNKGKQRSEYQP